MKSLSVDISLQTPVYFFKKFMERHHVGAGRGGGVGGGVVMPSRVVRDGAIKINFLLKFEINVSTSNLGILFVDLKAIRPTMYMTTGICMFPLWCLGIIMLNKISALLSTILLEAKLHP